MIEVPATAVTDPSWLSAQLSLSAKRYPLGDQVTLGVLWWYSASTVLLGPFVDGKDPSLRAITLLLEADGRVLDARSPARHGDPVSGVRDMLTAAITSVSKVSGARARQLWAITTDSLANRLLWAGRPETAVDVAAAIGPELPRPRYVEVNGRQFVRRGSCCLIFQGVTTPKCTSCPRQTPETRLNRLNAII
ncbi:MAG: (2Fe-2S)-binding protein [Kibdelosporangium sp.]